MLTTLQGVLVALGFIVPGFLCGAVSYQVAPKRKMETHEFVLSSLALSFVCHISCFSIWAKEYLATAVFLLDECRIKSGDWPPAEWSLIISAWIVVPVLWGLILGGARRAELAKLLLEILFKFLRERVFKRWELAKRFRTLKTEGQEVWDGVFYEITAQQSEMWIRVRCDEYVYQGLMKKASEQPDPKQLHLVNVSLLHPVDLHVIKKLPDKEEVLLLIGDSIIRAIHFMKGPEGTTTEPKKMQPV